MSEQDVQGFNDDDLDLEPEEETLSSFERKYKAQMRQIVTQRLDLPISTLPVMLKEQIKVNPEFQRRERWDELRQSRLIESLLMNVPIPPVFLGEDEYGCYVVLDGRQRLTAIQKFLNNTLRLEGLEVWSDLNGFFYDDLVKRGVDKHLTRRFVPAIAILKESSSVVKYDVFDRLNTGGVKANEMEVRNAVFRGKFTETLHKVTRCSSFCKLWDIPEDFLEAEANPVYQKMQDLSIALRFFALYDPDKMDGPFRDYLGDFMDGRNKLYSSAPETEAADIALFERASLNCLKIFGKNAFRNPTKQKKGTKSVPLADAVMIALSEVNSELLTEAVVKKINFEFEALFSVEAFNKAISGGTNGKGAIKTRIEYVKGAVERGLKA